MIELTLCSFLKRVVGVTSLVMVCSAFAYAQDGTAPANQPDAPVPAPPEQTPAEETPKEGLSVGAEVWYGMSNLPGAHRFRDGFWLGAGPFYPSNVYGLYNGKDGLAAKVAVSVGKFYNGSNAGFDQPIEAYVSKPVGKVTLTAGKFYVPFEIAEWEYETEFGLQANRDWGKAGSLTTALNYNRARNTPNFYARYARTFGHATFGLSVGGGRGFFYDTDHNRGVAADATIEHRRFRLESSATVARANGSASQFSFAFVRLNYQLDPKTGLYISRHSWTDRLEQEGNGHYSTVGAVYQLNKNISLEGALSHSGELDRNISWVQLHYVFER